jgi:hypothetical protein
MNNKLIIIDKPKPVMKKTSENITIDIYKEPRYFDHSTIDEIKIYNKKISTNTESVNDITPIVIIIIYAVLLLEIILICSF